jgi:hypothetical protein
MFARTSSIAKLGIPMIDMVASSSARRRLQVGGVFVGLLANMKTKNRNLRLHKFDQSKLSVYHEG